MNEQTTKLLEELANKLGTTTEYLWTILLKQAPIDATITLLQTIVIIIFGWVLWKVHKKLLSTPKGQNVGNYYQKHDLGAELPMFLATIGWVIMLAYCFINFSCIVSGYFNPEYWALKQILNALGNH